MLAKAESSPYPGEAATFRKKAEEIWDKYLDKNFTDRINQTLQFIKLRKAGFYMTPAEVKAACEWDIVNLNKMFKDIVDNEGSEKRDDWPHAMAGQREAA